MPALTVVTPFFLNRWSGMAEGLPPPSSKWDSPIPLDDRVPILAGLGAGTFFFAVVAFLIGIVATLAEDDCGGAEAFALLADIYFFVSSVEQAMHQHRLWCQQQHHCRLCCDSHVYSTINLFTAVGSSAIIMIA